MAGSYRDELDAALRQAEALRQENQALRHENATLRAGPAQPQPIAPTATAPGRAIFLILGVVVATMVLGALVTVRMLRSSTTGVMATSAPPPVALAAVPTEAELARAIDAVRPAVRARCGTGLSHAVTVVVVFDSSGAVQSATPLPPAQSAPEGLCAADAVRAARVSPFTAPSFATTAPFIL